MEFLFTLLFWVFGTPPVTPASTARVINQGVVQTQADASALHDRNRPNAVVRNGEVIRSAHAIIIFEDTHFRPIR